MVLLLACVHLPPPVATTKQVEVRALVDEDWLGVRFDMAPGWHIYWLNPGQSGMATSIEGAGDARFPGPQRFISPGDIENYGWSESVVALVENPGTVTTLQVDWLACKDMCLMQDATFQVDGSLVNARLDEHVDQLPRPLGELVPTVEGDTLTLAADDFFPYSETETNLLGMEKTYDGLRLQVSGPLSGLAQAGDVFYEIEVP